MTNLTATTPFATFTRNTHTAYTHIAVWANPDGQPMRLVGAAGIAARKKGLEGPQYIATWHRTERSARAARPGYNAKAVLQGVFPVDALAPAVAAMFKAPEPEPEPVVEPAVITILPVAAEPEHIMGVLTNAEARYLINTAFTIRQVGKTYTHQLKADKNDPTLARTYCGVPIKGAAQNWLQTSDSLTCPTCVATRAKMQAKAARILAKAA